MHVIQKTAMASHLSSTKKNVDICGGGRRAVDARSGGLKAGHLKEREQKIEKMR